MTRGRRRDPTLEPTRQLQTSRAFRERRAAHLKALEEQVKSQSEEIKGLKARLGEPDEEDEEDGEGEVDEEARRARDDALAGLPESSTSISTTSGHRRGTLSFSTTASSSRSSLEQMSPEHGAKRRLTEGYWNGGDRRRPATSSGLSGSSTPHPPPAPCSNCEVVRQQAHQLLLMLGDLEQRMGTMRAAGVVLGQTLQQHQQLNRHQPHLPSPSMPATQQAPSVPPPYSSSSSSSSSGTNSISGGGASAHAPTHRALWSVPVAANAAPTPLDLPRLSLPSLPTASLPTKTGATPGIVASGAGSGGSRLPPTPAEEKCCLGIFSCDEAGRIIV